jgi:hypothetical protein
MKYKANKKCGLPQPLPQSFTGTATMGVQGNTFNCLWVSVLLVCKQNHFHYLPHGTGMLHPLDFGAIKVSVQKAPSKKDMCLKDSGIEVELKINVLQVIHFIVAIW